MMVRFGKDKKEFKEDEFRQVMSEFGDSLLVMNDGEIVKSRFIQSILDRFVL